MKESEVIDKIYSILKYRSEERNEDTFNFIHRSKSEMVSHDLLGMVWERATNGLLLTDSDGIIIAVNTAFCSMVNMGANELKGALFTVIYDKTLDRKQMFDEYFTQVQTQTIVRKEEKDLRFNSGHCVKAEIFTSILTDDADESFVLREFREINKRK